MKTLRYFALAVIAGAGFAAAVPASDAQISVNIGPEPACPYGYYDYAPYACAPYGYYGPEWFRGGVFIGGGPWYHGPRHFYGHVDSHFDDRHGYHGDHPHPGDRRDESRGFAPQNFHGDVRRDGRGHERGHR